MHKFLGQIQSPSGKRLSASGLQSFLENPPALWVVLLFWFVWNTKKKNLAAG